MSTDRANRRDPSSAAPTSDRPAERPGQTEAQALVEAAGLALCGGGPLVRGWQVAVARAAGVSKSTVGRIWAGERPLTADTARRLRALVHGQDAVTAEMAEATGADEEMVVLRLLRRLDAGAWRRIRAFGDAHFEPAGGGE